MENTLTDFSLASNPPFGQGGANVAIGVRRQESMAAGMRQNIRLDDLFPSRQGLHPHQENLARHSQPLNSQVGLCTLLSLADAWHYRLSGVGRPAARCSGHGDDMQSPVRKRKAANPRLVTVGQNLPAIPD